MRSTRSCRNLLHLFQCSICSPAQGELFLLERIGGFSVPALRVCAEFCERLYDRCGSAGIALSAAKPAERVDLVFRNGVEFCRAVGLRVVTVEDAESCFSAAHAVRAPSRLQILLAMSAAAAVATTHRARR